MDPTLLLAHIRASPLLPSAAFAACSAYLEPFAGSSAAGALSARLACSALPALLYLGAALAALRALGALLSLLLGGAGTPTFMQNVTLRGPALLVVSPFDAALALMALGLMIRSY